VNRLEGANCADLPGFVIDKYFGSSVQKEPLRAMVGFAICQRCVVREACRDQALNMPGLPAKGVIGGVAVAEIRRARKWRDYETGITEPVPTVERPEWLPRSDATETVEQVRIEADGDEPPIER
jgi:hypothetical protein